MNKILVFIKKDFLIEKSYKFAFLSGIFSTFFSLLIFFFIDKLYGQKITPHLLQYGTGYFEYVFISLLLFNYTGAGLGSISEKIRTEKMQHTFEATINNERIIMPFLLSLFLFNFIMATMETLIYIFGGIYILGIKFQDVNFLTLSISFLLSIFCFYSIGIISSCFIILFRRGNPLNFILNSAEGFFGGVYFPVTILPLWAQKISKILPITYAINAVEKSIYSKATILDIKNELIVLFLFSVFLFPVSIYFFKMSIYYSRKKGNLGFY